jgi:hypothetical protein
MICELSSSGTDQAASLVREARSQAHGLFAMAKSCVQKEAGELHGILQKKCYFDGAGANVRHQISP